MSILVIEGFEGFGTTTASVTNAVDGLDAKYTGVNVTGSTRVNIESGWGGGFSLDMNGDTANSTVTVDFPDTATVYIGFAYRGAFGLFEDLILSVLDSNGSPQVSLRQIPYSRRIEILRGTTIRLGLSTPVIEHDDWCYIEFMVFGNNSTGSWELRVNGITVASDTNVDTQAGTSATMNGLLLRSVRNFSTDPTRFDDLYITDDAFLGPLKIEGLLPGGAGDDTEWTPSTGSNYTCVDENPSDLDGTDYVESGTTGNSDFYTYSSTTLVTVHGVQVNTDAATSDATDFDLINKVKSGTTEGTATAQSVTDDSGVYFTFWDIFEQNPDTTAAWTTSDINSMQAGIEVG